MAGAVLGFERNIARRPAGLRTHALVALSAALFTITGAYGFQDVAGGTTGDPARVAAQVVSGLGFIGAGAIVRNGTAVSGLTTAATVWTAGALGLIFAAGRYYVGLGALAITVFILVALRPIRQVSDMVGFTKVTLVFLYEVGHGTLGPVLSALESVSLNITDLSVDDGRLANRRFIDTNVTPTVRRLTITGSLTKGDVSLLTPVIEQVKLREEVLGVEIVDSE